MTDWRAYPPSADTFRQLKAAGKKTLLLSNAPRRGYALVDRVLLAGDRATALVVGLPPDRFLGKPLGAIDADTQEFARPLVERAGLVSAINEAWAMMAAKLPPMLSPPMAGGTGGARGCRVRDAGICQGAGTGRGAEGRCGQAVGWAQFRGEAFCGEVGGQVGG